MDDDVDQAKAGDRVGIALRNTEESFLSQGSLIVKNDGTDTVEVHLRTELNFISAPFARYKPNVGGIIHVAIDLQFVVGRIEKNNEEKIVIKWESPLMIRKHGTPRLLICQLDAKPRIIGYAIDYKKLE
jgi:selenocysteine-specific translation elongation factor